MLEPLHCNKISKKSFDFYQDNVVGTFNLLELARKIDNLELFYYFSTDEVFDPLMKMQNF